MNRIETHTLSCGIKVVFLPTNSVVTYAGMAIRSGTRDEDPNLEGIAHFVEHMLFKGTQRRRAWHVLNRMEAVGGELNAFTTKEDTFVYTLAPKGEIERSMELIADVVFRSTFPEKELKLEKGVVMDEINVYKDSPSDQIFDDFEEILFRGHPLGRRILGSKESLERMTSEDCHHYVQTNFHAHRMLFFCMGPTHMKRIVQLGERYFRPFEVVDSAPKVAPGKCFKPGIHYVDRGSYQSHVVMGGLAPDMYSKERMAASVVTNILGGPGMNSKLNVLLREKRGWAYQVDATLSCLSDVGYWQIYFGCDPEYVRRSIEIVHHSLDKMMEKALTPASLRAALKQMAGQVSISAEQTEQTFLSMGKVFLYGKKYRPIEEVVEEVRSLTAEDLMRVAQQMFAMDNRVTLVYNGESSQL